MIIYNCCSFSGFYRRIRGKRGEEWKKWGDDRGVKEREESGDGKREGGKEEKGGRKREEGIVRERKKRLFYGYFNTLSGGCFRKD